MHQNKQQPCATAVPASFKLDTLENLKPWNLENLGKFGSSTPINTLNNWTRFTLKHEAP
jgi:hypothetical protein